MKTALLLIASNLFMTYAWYGHLRTLKGYPWYLAALASWGVAFFEYMLQVPATRRAYCATTTVSARPATGSVVQLTLSVPCAELQLTGIRHTPCKPVM